MRALIRGLLPGLLVVLAVVLADRFAPPDHVAWFVSTYGIVAYVGGLVLAWIFHRSRAFIVLLLVGGMELFVVNTGDASELSRLLQPFVVDGMGRASTLFMGTAVLGLVGVLSLMRDRGLASRVGLLQLFGAGGMAVAAATLATDSGRLAQLANEPGIASLVALTWAGLPRITVLVGLFTAATVVYALQRYRGPIERGLLWTALFVVAAMHEGTGVDRASIFLMAAGLVMMLAVVETSYVLAYRDELTGLPGRRALMQYLDGIQGTYTVAMIDVDRFKRFNDRHGHDVGDQVLKMVASRLARAPGGGKAYRYGGEEFTLLYPGRGCEDAAPHLEKVRESVAKARFSLRSWRRPRKKPERGRIRRRRQPKKLSVTVSIGLADSNGDASRPHAVLAEADQALYRAKKAGRNRVSE